MPLLRTTLMISALLIHFGLLAQPANDDCNDAVALCAQQPITGNNTGAVGPPGQCGMQHVVWYTFTTNSVGGAATITVGGIDCPAVAGMGNTLAAIVLSGDGSCALPSFQVIAPGCATNATSIELVTAALAPATTYWVAIGGLLGTGNTQYAQCDFTVAAGGPGVNVVNVDFDAGESVEILLGGSTQLQAIGGTGHVWNPPSGLTSNTIANPIAQPTETTVYTVTAQVDGCTFSDQLTVEVTRAVSPPNTFTPNGDGINDVWLIPGIEDFPQAKVQIHDRWGQRVYQSIGYREPFTGAGLPTATYYWHIDITNLSGGGSSPYSGFVTIIR